MSEAGWRDGLCRCAWLGTWAGAADPLYREYHDQEWGLPCRDERQLFELLCLEGAQAGLAWITILKKRENYRSAFCNFDIEQIARFGPDEIESLMANPGIVRNRAKIKACIGNARAWLVLREAQGNIADYLWAFIGGTTRQNNFNNMQEIPARSAESDAMSQALKKAGFKFVGSTICYAFMQATGMVNDHTTDCFRHRQVQA